MVSLLPSSHMSRRIFPVISTAVALILLSTLYHHYCYSGTSALAVPDQPTGLSGLLLHFSSQAPCRVGDEAVPPPPTIHTLNRISWQAPRRKKTPLVSPNAPSPELSSSVAVYPPTDNATPTGVPPLDSVFDSFSCFGPFSLSVKGETKRCLMSVRPILYPGVPWGPLVASIWAGDFGYWIETVESCPPGFRRGFTRATRMVCSVQLDFTELPPIRRLTPEWTYHAQAKTIVLGYSVTKVASLTEINTCPPQFRTQKGLCDDMPAAGVAKFEDVVQRVSAARNHVVLTLCSFDYAEAALVWYHANAARGVEGLLVVAMDLGAYSYLSNREVPVVYLPTIAPLAPCCLHSFKMVPWRATNDVKIRAILGALNLGVSVVMQDMDVTTLGHSADMQLLEKYDLVYTGSYSFMFTYSAPQPAVVEMWTHVLEEVLAGGWDQDQFKYWGKAMERRISSLELSPTRDILRSQNNFVYITDSRLRALLHSSRILQPLVIEPGAPVWRIIASMVVSYPTQSSRYLTWGGGSECGRIDVLNRDGWIARRDCMRALVALSVCSQRYAVLSEDLAQYFDMDTLGRWFPVIQSSRLEFLVPNAALHDRSGDASSSLSLHATSHDVIVQQLLSNKTLVRLADADAATVSKVPVCSLPKWFESHQFFFVIPTLPSRAQFKCMRGGGPATVDNPDPKCASSKV